MFHSRYPRDLFWSAVSDNDTHLQSYGFMYTLWEVKDQVPPALTYTLFAGNIILNSLNLFWYVKVPEADLND